MRNPRIADLPAKLSADREAYKQLFVICFSFLEFLM